VMIPDEIRPLAPGRQRREHPQRHPERIRLLSGQRQKEVVVEDEVEEEMHALPFAQEKGELVGRDIRLRQEDRVGPTRYEKPAELDEEAERIVGIRSLDPFPLEEEGRGV